MKKKCKCAPKESKSEGEKVLSLRRRAEAQRNEIRLLKPWGDSLQREIKALQEQNKFLKLQNESLKK